MTPQTPTPDPTTQQVVDLETPEQKYARLYSGPPNVQQPQVPPVPTTQVVAPQQVAMPQELVDTLSALKSKLDTLEQRVTQPVTPPTPVSKSAWVDKIREGDFEGAEKVLMESIRRQMEPEIKSKAYEDALSATQVQLEIDRHLTSVRGANPDLVRFESYLQAPVNAKVEAAKAANRIHSAEDFVREYKKAVDEEVQNLRNLTLQYRADGKAEATTRIQDVRGAFTPTPQQVGDHSTPSTPSNQGESADDYFSRRKASEARLRGLQV